MRRIRYWVYHCTVAALTLFLLLSCGPVKPQGGKSVHTLSMRTLYPEALEVARAWKEDAFLVGADVDFALDDTEHNHLPSFFFLSPSTEVVGLFVNYDVETGTFSDEWLSIAKMDRSRYPEILDDEWPIDSVDALQIAQNHGGSEFLASRAGWDLHLLMHLRKRQTSGQSMTYWTVLYYDQYAREDLRMRVDASTGDVEVCGPSEICN